MDWIHPWIELRWVGLDWVSIFRELWIRLNSILWDDCCPFFY